MSETAGKLLCYNKGCCQSFEPDKNTSESCVFHPGIPVFHDAYKSWSCCKKKSTDFTEFLNFKGCTTSFHSNEKPVEPEKPKSEPLGKEEVIVYEAPKPANNICLAIRPSENEQMVRLGVAVTKSLSDLLAKTSNEKLNVEISSGLDSTKIQVGTSCKNSACKQVYESDASNAETCTYHPGVPIFHEGLKFWSCCKKRTTDFETFLEQAGCTTGSHTWIKTEAALTRVDSRYDFHQTGAHVVLSIYTKGCNPEKSYFEANAVKLHVYVSYDGDTVFEKEFVLQGIINVAASAVTLAATKVEVKLKKAASMTWTKLSLTPPEKEPDNLQQSPQNEA